MHKKLIVVLGMHRSGTSVIARGLQVMGVKLGNKFLPSREDNITGFWEDVDLNALNVEMLKSLNNDWHFLTPIQPDDVETLRRKGYFGRAIKMLQKKTSNIQVFGFKDPRVAKLLLFWKEVFAQSGLRVSYIIAIRHPLSVSESLAKRDGFDLEKSSLLWLDHVISSLVGILGENCVLVDYDRLMQSPEAELTRIAQGLQLQIDPLELEMFKTEFLDETLRHNIYQPEDLMREKSILPLVQDIYTFLMKVATENIQLDDAIAKDKIVQWMTEFARLKPILVYMDKFIPRIDALTASNSQLQVQLVEILNSNTWKLALFIRKIQMWMFPSGSYGEYLVKKIFFRNKK